MGRWVGFFSPQFPAGKEQLLLAQSCISTRRTETEVFPLYSIVKEPQALWLTENPLQERGLAVNNETWFCNVQAYYEIACNVILSFIL